MENSEGGKTVKILEDVLNQLHAAHYFSKKIGENLFYVISIERDRNNQKKFK